MIMQIIGYLGYLVTNNFSYFSATWCENENTCNRNGNCTELGEDDFECHCIPGYTGRRCEKGLYSFITLFNFRQVGLGCSQVN